MDSLAESPENFLDLDDLPLDQVIGAERTETSCPLGRKNCSRECFEVNSFPPETERRVGILLKPKMFGWKRRVKNNLEVLYTAPCGREFGPNDEENFEPWFAEFKGWSSNGEFHLW